MSLEKSIRLLMLILQAENEALAAGDNDAAARLLPDKQAAAAALHSAIIPGALIDSCMAAHLQDLADENTARLTQAIKVQGRILEMVASAARLPASSLVPYDARGGALSSNRALALALRA